MDFIVEEEYSQPATPWWRIALTPRGASFVAVVLIGFALVAFHRPGQLRAAGPFDPPRQETLSHWVPLATPNRDVEIWGTHSYVVEAEIMSRARYWWDDAAEFSPVDFLLAWGPLTKEPALTEINWSQSGRWGYYRWKGRISVGEKVIARNSANTHIIPDPAQKGLKRELLSLKKGDAVRLEGYLVSVHSTTGARWESSHSRTDTGGGSCEILYVTACERIE